MIQVLSNPTTIIGQMIRDLREQEMISQNKLAHITGFDHSYISRLESGKRIPSREAILTIAQALQVDASLLLITAGYIPEPLASQIQDGQVSPRVVYRYLLEAQIEIDSRLTTTS